MMLSVICADAQFFHRVGRFGGRRGQLHQHAVQLGSGLSSDGAVLGEQGKNAGGLLNVHAETVRLRAAIVQRLAEIGDIADCLAGASRQSIGHLRSLRPFQVEHAQRVGHVFGGISNGHSIGRGQIQSAGQAASENIRDAHAGLAEIVDRVGGIRSGINRGSSGFDGGGTQLVHLGAGRAGVRLDGAHLLVEVCGHLDRSHAESGHGQSGGGHAAGDKRGLAAGVLHAGCDCSRSASGAGHRRLIGGGVCHQPDDDVLVLRQNKPPKIRSNAPPRRSRPDCPCRCCQSNVSWLAACAQWPSRRWFRHAG